MSKYNDWRLLNEMSGGWNLGLSHPQSLNSHQAGDGLEEGKAPPFGKKKGEKAMPFGKGGKKAPPFGKKGGKKACKCCMGKGCKKCGMPAGKPKKGKGGPPWMKKDKAWDEKANSPALPGWGTAYEDRPTQKSWDWQQVMAEWNAAAGLGEVKCHCGHDDEDHLHSEMHHGDHPMDGDEDELMDSDTDMPMDDDDDVPPDHDVDTDGIGLDAGEHDGDSPFGDDGVDLSSLGLSDEQLAALAHLEDMDMLGDQLDDLTGGDGDDDDDDDDDDDGDDDGDDFDPSALGDDGGFDPHAMKESMHNTRKNEAREFARKIAAEYGQTIPKRRTGSRQEFWESIQGHNHDIRRKYSDGITEYLEDYLIAQRDGKASPWDNSLDPQPGDYGFAPVKPMLPRGQHFMTMEGKGGGDDDGMDMPGGGGGAQGKTAEQLFAAAKRIATSDPGLAGEIIDLMKKALTGQGGDMMGMDDGSGGMGGMDDGSGGGGGMGMDDGSGGMDLGGGGGAPAGPGGPGGAGGAPAGPGGPPAGPGGPGGPGGAQPGQQMPPM